MDFKYPCLQFRFFYKTAYKSKPTEQRKKNNQNPLKRRRQEKEDASSSTLEPAELGGQVASLFSFSFFCFPTPIFLPIIFQIAGCYISWANRQINFEKPFEAHKVYKVIIVIALCCLLSPCSLLLIVYSSGLYFIHNLAKKKKKIQIKSKKQAFSGTLIGKLTKQHKLDVFFFFACPLR